MADRLKAQNRAEYILYMWQVEDIVRSFGCDFDRLREGYLRHFSVEEGRREALEAWYADIVLMMRGEGVAEAGGHLQINRNAVAELDELHRSLSVSDKFPFYRAAYMKVLPYIVEVRGKGADKSLGETELCLNILYGMLMLRLQKKPVSDATAKAAADVTTFLGMLSDYYFKDREKPLEF